jgi:hypothetical protein
MLRKAYSNFILLLVDQVSKYTYKLIFILAKKLKYSNGSKFFIENEGMAWD